MNKNYDLKLQKYNEDQYLLKINKITITISY